MVDLRNSSSLMEDVWITHSDGEPPLWLCDTEIRDGIRAMLKVDRCLEEQKRLGMEADNMCRWLASELTATETAMLDPNSEYQYYIYIYIFNPYFVLDEILAILLEQKLTQLRFLEKRWANFFVTPVRLRSAVKNASYAARIASGKSVHRPLEWLTPLTSPNCGIAIVPDDNPFSEALSEQDDDDVNHDIDLDLPKNSGLVPGADEAVLDDYLFGDAAVSEQDEDEDADGYVVDIVWAVPVSLLSTFMKYNPKFH
jgi:hypothetical protein